MNTVNPPAGEFNAANFYKILRESGRLTGVRCNDCGRLSPEARPMCAACRSFNLAWHPFSGRATLSAFTCISVVPDYWGRQGYGRDNPYCTGIVTLEEGPRISARITGVDGGNPQSIRTGMALALDLADLDPERPSLAFKPA